MLYLRWLITILCLYYHSEQDRIFHPVIIQVIQHRQWCGHLDIRTGYNVMWVMPLITILCRISDKICSWWGRSSHTILSCIRLEDYGGLLWGFWWAMDYPCMGVCSLYSICMSSTACYRIEVLYPKLDSTVNSVQLQFHYINVF